MSVRDFKLYLSRLFSNFVELHGKSPKLIHMNVDLYKYYFLECTELYYVFTHYTKRVLLQEGFVGSLWGVGVKVHRSKSWPKFKIVLE